MYMEICAPSLIPKSKLYFNVKFSLTTCTAGRTYTVHIYSRVTEVAVLRNVVKWFTLILTLQSVTCVRYTRTLAHLRLWLKQVLYLK